MNDLRKCLLILLSIVAFGQMAWAQQSINVNNENDLRTYLTNSQYDGYTFNLTNNITIPHGNGEFEVRYRATINMNGKLIMSEYPLNRIFHVVSTSGSPFLPSLTLTGNGTLSGGGVTNGNGGGIYNEGVLVLQNITIQNCSATNGGAVYNTGTMTISGSTITGNTASGNGGGIYNTGTLNMNGYLQIHDNTSNNVYLPSGKTITVNGTFNSNANIGVTLADGAGAFTSGYSNYNGSTNPANVFHPDNTEDYFVSLSNGEAALIMIDWPGAGTENDPYLVYTKEKLDLLATRVNEGNNYTDKYFKLMDNLTYTYSGGSNESNYTSIGNLDKDFNGHFDGNNKTISGIRIYNGSADCQGLFGSLFVDGEVKDLTLTDAHIVGNMQTGGVVGTNAGTVTNCQATASVTISGSDMTGGIVGSNHGTVSQCISSVTIGSNSMYIGAIAGYNGSSRGILSDNLAFEAMVPAANGDYHGAIAGINDGNGTLERNYYRNCTVAGVTNAINKGCADADVTTNNGAISVHTLSLGNGITASPHTISYGGIDYYAPSSTITLACTTPAPLGHHYVYSVNGETITGDTFTMPAADATVTVTAEATLEYELLSDLGTRLYYRFNYPSTSVTGEPIMLSAALVFWKTSSTGSYAIEAAHLYCHHTVAANSQCPSISISNALNNSNLDPNYFMASFLTSGSTTAYGDYQDIILRSIVIMPDYEGYGVSGDRTPPYLAEEITAQQSVDAMIYGLQIYQQLVNDGAALPLSDSWRGFISGYSQGGSVALAAHRYIEQNSLYDELHFRGTICGDGTYDLITTLRYYLDDNGDSYGVSTEHRQGQTTLPLVVPMIIKGMMLSDPYAGSHSLSDYLSQQFLDTGILDWLDSKTMTNDDIVAAWINQLNNGFTATNGTTYTPAQMAEMFTKKTVSSGLGTSTVVWADLSKVFTTGFYNYLNDVSNFNSVPTATGDPYQDMHRALANNNLCTDWTPNHRIVFKHSKKDMVVPYGNYLAFKDAHSALENVRYKVDDEFSTADHLAAGTTFFMYLYQWVGDFQWLDESPVEWRGSGTEDDPYLIGSTDEWQLLANRVNNGNSTYSDKFFKLVSDITVAETFTGTPSKMIGTSESKSFQGTFDGNGHTITVNYIDNRSSGHYCAPFRIVKSATIKNLHVTGTITKAYDKHAAGFIGQSFGYTFINNCRSSVIITVNENGDGSSGGFVGDVRESDATDDIHLTNCLFDGKLLTNNGTTKWGGFIGWVDDVSDAFFENCLFAPQEVSSFIVNNSDSRTFSRTEHDSDLHFTNCYYKTLIQLSQGTTNASDMSDALLLSNLGYSWEIMDNTIVPIMAPHSLEGNGTEVSPYLIASENDWNALATNVFLGETYNGKYFQMTQDISVCRMVGTYTSDSDYKSFSGTFDGNGHTLNVTISGGKQGMAPFHSIGGAVIKDLVVTGSVTGTAYHAAGLVGFSAANTTNYIENCLVSTDVYVATLGGGIVGHIKGSPTTSDNTSHMEITGCVYNGTITNTAVNITDPDRSVGGLVGWTSDRDLVLTFVNCLFDGSYDKGSSEVEFHPIAVKSYLSYEMVLCTVTNTYYFVEPDEDNDGKNNIITTSAKFAHSITADPEITMTLSGTATEYSVSGITYTNFLDGIMYENSLYGGYNESVRLDLSCTPPEGYACFGYSASAGTLSNQLTDYYTLGMPDEDVTISANYVAIVTTYYVDENGLTHDNIEAVPLDNTMTVLEGGTYLVNSNITFDNLVSFSGVMILILADGCNMTITGDNSLFGITLTTVGFHNLTIYGQEEQSGSLHAPYIGADVTINGGTVTGNWIQSGNLTINRGIVNTALHADNSLNPTNSITINGGQVTTPEGGDGISIQNGDIVLGLTHPTDFIHATAYTLNNGTVSVKSGQVLMDDNSNYYTGTLTDTEIATIAGQTLRPASVTQPTVLFGGLNWWSTNLDITLDQLKDEIATALGADGLATIKSQNGSITYTNGEWRPAEMDFDIREMYQIQVSTGCEITLTGLPVNPADYVITIHAGINWIGFLSGESISIDEALSGLYPEEGDVVKSSSGTSTYNGNGIWRGTIDNLEPGRGYIYHSKATEDKTFTFPNSQK